MVRMRSWPGRGEGGSEVVLTVTKGPEDTIAERIFKGRGCAIAADIVEGGEALEMELFNRFGERSELEWWIHCRWDAKSSGTFFKTRSILHLS